MTRYATNYGAYNIESMPSQPQIALCHGFFVPANLRGHGYGKALKRDQENQLKADMFDYAICTCDKANEIQQKVLASAGWSLLGEFSNSKTGGKTQIWGRDVSQIK